MITFRRYYLDQLLAAVPFSGDVLDIGGERAGSRGDFKAPLGAVNSWKYLNIDPKTYPDICASAYEIPLPDGCADFIKFTEVLEHLRDPARALAECNRLLKDGGKVIASVPFLANVHGDPEDYTRWTSSGLADIWEKAGFSHVKIESMGGLIAVVSDLFEHYCHHEFTSRGSLRWRTKALRVLLRRVLAGALLRADSKFAFKNEFTTGYFIEARK